MSLNLLLASTSTIYGDSYLNYLLKPLSTHFKDTEEILFIPYARPSGITYDDYTSIAQKGFNSLGITIKGLHEFADIRKAVVQAKGIFTGGGNTFVLLKQLYENDLLHILRDKLLTGTPYLGTSAGSNICGRSIKTTNDMPITYPPSFEALDLIPFNINPHYLDPESGLQHMGETRETRIKEFHEYNKTPVIGLREGSWLEVRQRVTILRGHLTARVFTQGSDPYEMQTDHKVTFE